MWYINSSRATNNKGFRVPNLSFLGLGFYEGDEPAVEVHSLHELGVGAEGLADYMDFV